MTRVLTAAACIILFVQSGCTQNARWSAVDRMIARDYPEVQSISTDSLAERIKDTTSVRPVLLDSRTADEYAVSHLRTAIRIDPEAQNFPALDSLSTNDPIVVYCSVGYRSAAVASRLQEKGFTNVVNLEGSIFKWVNEGYPLYRSGERVRQVHPYDKIWGRLLDDELRAYTPGDESD